jgi:hypothetical protein
MKVGDPFFFIDYKWKLIDIGIVKNYSLEFASKENPELPGIVVGIIMPDQGELRQFNELSPYYKRNEQVSHGWTSHTIRHEIIERAFKNGDKSII